MGLFSLPSAADEFKYLFTVDGETNEIILKRDKPKEEPKAETKEKESSSVKEQLQELKSLYDEKLISKAVYDQKQKDIIDKM